MHASDYVVAIDGDGEGERRKQALPMMIAYSDLVQTGIFIVFIGFFRAFV